MSDSLSQVRCAWIPMQASSETGYCLCLCREAPFHNDGRVLMYQSWGVVLISSKGKVLGGL
jgi:hypothetical protein